MENSIPGDYIAGFVDGEGCFALKFRKDVRHKRTGSPTYFYWDIEFAIVLRDDDKEVLDLIKNSLGCGTISHSRGSVRYAVNNMGQLVDIIVPFFEKYCLRAKKRFDFELWKEALFILKRNQQQLRVRGEKGFRKINWKEDDVERLKSIHEEMERFKSHRPSWKWLS